MTLPSPEYCTCGQKKDDHIRCGGCGILLGRGHESMPTESKVYEHWCGHCTATKPVDPSWKGWKGETPAITPKPKARKKLGRPRKSVTKNGGKKE